MKRSGFRFSQEGGRLHFDNITVDVELFLHDFPTGEGTGEGDEFDGTGKVRVMIYEGNAKDEGKLNKSAGGVLRKHFKVEDLSSREDLQKIVDEAVAKALLQFAQWQKGYPKATTSRVISAIREQGER